MSADEPPLPEEARPEATKQQPGRPASPVKPIAATAVAAAPARVEKATPTPVPAANETTPLWQVTGGSEAGGIIVRSGKELNSTKLPDRLSCGAVVAQVALLGERL